MATTKWARYRFVVKEAATEAREVREGFIDLVADPFIVAEPCDKKPDSEYPLQGGDFLAFELPQETSLRSAKEIAKFFNDHVQYVSITRFGDAEDAVRDVRQSEHEQRIDVERFALVIGMLREKLKVNDVPGATDALKAVESVAGDLIAGWSKAVRISHEVLSKFGQDEELDT
jgi:hypothetical protein